MSCAQERYTRRRGGRFYLRFANQNFGAYKVGLHVMQGLSGPLTKRGLVELSTTTVPKTY
jgi:hypothetical protein